MLELWERTRPMDPDVFAQKVLRAVARDTAIIVVPRWWNALWYLDRLSPALSMKLAQTLFERVRAHLEEAGVKPAGSLKTEAKAQTTPAVSSSN